MMINLHPDPAMEPITVRDAIGKDGWIECRREYRKGSTSWFRTGFDMPSPTLRATPSDWRWNIGGERRPFTESELKTVAGYPASFRLAPADTRTIWQRIGNSVPPPMMMAIAAHLREISLL